MFDIKLVKVYSKSPQKCSIEELDKFKSLVLDSGEVTDQGLFERIKRAEQLFFVRDENHIGIGAIKRPYGQYKSNVFEKAGVPYLAENYSLELGWVYVSPSVRGKGVGRKIMKAILDFQGDFGCFATTRLNNDGMHYLLNQHYFKKLGQEFPSDNGDYSLVLYVCMP